MIRLVLILFMATLLPRVATAKRLAPAKVNPVIHEGIRYVAPNDDGRRGYIEAWNIQTNKKLWDLTVFTNRIDPKLEKDVQWIFINKLSVRDGTLFVTSERGNTYQIDLKTKAITPADPVSSSPPGGDAQSRDIPPGSQ
jgi:outer membrane protein assembly factor BamB